MHPMHSHEHSCIRPGYIQSTTCHALLHSHPPTTSLPLETAPGVPEGTLEVPFCTQFPLPRPSWASITTYMPGPCIKILPFTGHLRPIEQPSEYPSRCTQMLG